MLGILSEERRRKREELLAATEGLLEKVRAEAARRTKTPPSAAQIGRKVGKVINRHEVGKHFEITIADGRFSFCRRAEAIAREAVLDGIYVIRTSEPQAALSAEETVRSYENLAQVERAFRTLKGVELRMRPIHHREERRVRSHIFLCLLAYYVEWHMRQALAPLSFDDENLPRERKQRDPVAPARPTISARRKMAVRETDDGLPIHSFTTLLAELGTRCRHRCRLQSDPGGPAFFMETQPTPFRSARLN
jgi:transposase